MVLNLPTRKATKIDALFIEDAYLLLECTLDRIIDGFGDFSLIAGKIVAVHVHQDDLKVTEGDDQQMITNRPYWPTWLMGALQRSGIHLLFHSLKVLSKKY